VCFFLLYDAKVDSGSNFNRKGIHFKLLPCSTGVSAKKIKQY